jgi:hypothetical protein
VRALSVKTQRVETVNANPVGLPDRSLPRVAGFAVLVSLFSFLYYFQHGGLLLYGDAVAHINIARRVFDSQTPSLLQLGTVWLPLPHLLMIPFIWINSMWQNGSGGSIPSMIAYVFGVMGIFRLVRGLLAANIQSNSAAEVGGWAAALAYGANPNLIYMQATAMTESIYLALFIWAVAYFTEFFQSLPKSLPRKDDSSISPITRPSLMRCALCLAGAELTRYDGWFLAGFMGAAVLVITLKLWSNRAFRIVGIKFLVAISIAPILWLAYNALVYGNALEFANGPYSAKAIELRVAAPNPALHNIRAAATYFLKSAQLNMAPGNWGRFWLTAAFLALLLAAWKLRSQWTTLLLLWVPLAFYSWSIAYGSVPIHVSTWWPFATFNQRYGLQLLPMFAVSAGLLTAFAYRVGASVKHGGKAIAVLLALVAVSYASALKATPACLVEAQRNWDIRHVLNSAVQRAVTGLPKDSLFLMDLGEHVGIMEQAGIPLRRVVNSENHRPWKRPTDPDGLWERALADPPHYVDYVIAFDGDQIDRYVNRANLRMLMELHVSGQPHARIYATRDTTNQSR